MTRFSRLSTVLTTLALGACAATSPGRVTYAPPAAPPAQAQPAPVAPAPRAVAPAAPRAIAQAPVAVPAGAVSSDADARFKSALRLLQAHQMHDAEAAFAALAHDFPAFSGPLTDLGIVYAQGRRPDDAVASLSRAIQANPGNAVALNWLGILYRRAGDYHRSEDAYRRAIAARADYAPAHLNLGILDEECLNRPQDALAEYRAYQQASAGGKLIVDVWIRELQARTPTTTAMAADEAAP